MGAVPELSERELLRNLSHVYQTRYSIARNVTLDDCTWPEHGTTLCPIMKKKVIKANPGPRLVQSQNVHALVVKTSNLPCLSLRSHFFFWVFFFYICTEQLRQICCLWRLAASTQSPRCFSADKRQVKGIVCDGPLSLLICNVLQVTQWGSCGPSLAPVHPFIPCPNTRFERCLDSNRR